MPTLVEPRARRDRTPPHSDRHRGAARRRRACQRPGLSSAGAGRSASARRRSRRLSEPGQHRVQRLPPAGVQHQVVAHAGELHDVRAVPGGRRSHTPDRHEPVVGRRQDEDRRRTQRRTRRPVHQQLVLDDRGLPAAPVRVRLRLRPRPARGRGSPAAAAANRRPRSAARRAGAAGRWPASDATAGWAGTGATRTAARAAYRASARCTTSPPIEWPDEHGRTRQGRRRGDDVVHVVRAAAPSAAGRNCRRARAARRRTSGSPPRRRRPASAPSTRHRARGRARRAAGAAPSSVSGCRSSISRAASRRVSCHIPEAKPCAWSSARHDPCGTTLPRRTERTGAYRSSARDQAPGDAGGGHPGHGDEAARPRLRRRRRDRGRAASSFPDDAYAEAGARIGTADEAWQADVVLKVNAPRDEEIGRLRDGATLISLLSPALNPDLVDALAAAADHGAGDGRRAAHLPGPVAGRAQLDGQHRRLPGGDRGRARLRPLLHRPGDRGRQGAAGEGAGRRRRRGRAGRDRRGQQPRRDRAGHRPGPRWPSRCARWAASTSPCDGEQEVSTDGYARRHGRGLRPARRRDLRRAGRRRRHHHHHRAHPRPAGAAADHRGRWSPP